MANLIKDLKGLTVGELIIKEPTEKRRCHGVVWKCLCSCGNFCEATYDTLVRNKRCSCGCIKSIKSNNAAFKALFDRYIRRAEKRGYEFHLTASQFKEITSQSCTYCHRKPEQRSWNKNKTLSYNYNGIDRKNNLLGYTIENSVPCCGICNDIKGKNLTYEEMSVAMEAILKYRGVYGKSSSN